MHYYIYLHYLKKDSDKARYVGRTIRTPKKRWGKDGQGYKEQYFYQAILKYGWDNFEHLILEEGDADSFAYLSEREKYWTKYYKADDITNGGYTILSGGIGGQYTPEERKRLSKVMRQSYIDNPMKKEKISNSLKEYYKKNPNIQKTKEHIQKNFHKEVICLETKEIYNSVRECARLNDLKSHTDISKMCNHTYKGKSIRGKHFMFLEEYLAK